jgi:ParB family chromosome partitioning protein
MIFLQTLRKRGIFEPGRITYIPVGKIRQSADQPRRRFEEIKQLADSVARYGVLQPLSVREEMDGYTLIAGERRLRAAKLVGLAEVPCVVLQADSRECQIIALVENLQRRELDFVEQAEGINRLITDFGMSQEEAARRIGLSQSAAANKLRLLKLPRNILEDIRNTGLSERHARALLRVDGEQEQTEILRTVISENMTVARTEEYIDEYLRQDRKRRLPDYFVNDVRPFINSVSGGVETLQRSGIWVNMTQTDTQLYTILTVKIRKVK